MNADQKKNQSVALVTGGAIRLGRAFVEELSRMDYRLAIHYNSSSKEARQLKSNLEKSGNQVEIFGCDFNDSIAVEQFIEKVMETMGRLDVLINSASIYQADKLMDSSARQLEDQWRINCLAPILLTRSFAMLNQTGLVINILDNKIHFEQYQYMAYLLAKKNLADFTRMAAMELAPHFRVNAIAPGVSLPMDSRPAEYLDYRLQSIPLKKIGGVRPLQQALRYLIENDFVTGEILTVDGGEAHEHIGRNAGEYGLQDA